METISISASCLQSWQDAPSLQEDGRVLFHWLAANAEPENAGPDGRALEEDRAAGSEWQSWDDPLGLLVSLLRAERGFLIEVQSSAPGTIEIGAVLASRDYDGERVSQPERKIPLQRLREVARSQQPATLLPVGAESAGSSAGAATAHGAAFPVVAEGTVLALVYLENRFQALDLSRENIRLTRAHTLLLGCQMQAARLQKENHNLWLDLTRLRESQGAAQTALTPATPHRRPAARNTLRNELKGDYSSIVGESPRIVDILRVIDRISSSCAPVLINGESGTGKELVAQAIHHNSPRRGKAFVSENCGALTETLLESELFGYVKGAFTGAGKDHKGLFELAEGGTLFLDEVGDMSTGMQKKLLRVLQEGVIRRVGGKDFIAVDVRIISATNKDLLEEVRAGNFREDLYYRLNVINLKLPPLRERKEDVPLLVEQFLTELGRNAGKAPRIDPGAMEKLAGYDWPGNIRELRNEINKLVALAEGDIRPQDLSDAVRNGDRREVAFHELEKELPHLTLREATERLEKEMIRQALEQCQGNKSLMAKLLQVPKTSLYNKISKYGFDRA